MSHLSHQLLERIGLLTRARTAREGELVQRLWAGYGEIVRVYLSGAHWPSVIVKQVRPARAPRPDAGSGAHSHARKLRSYAIEAAWYERYAPRCDNGSRVARLLHREQLDVGQVLVLEDLDAAGYSIRCERPDRRGISVCLDWLAQFHACFAGDAAEHLWPMGTYWHLATRPDELAASRDHLLCEAAPTLAARLHGARFRTLVHGDSKAENFCFTSGLATVAAVDFQYVGGGVGVQDLAYFFSSCLDDAACEAHAEEFLDTYFSSLRRALATRHPTLDAAALEAEWRALYPTAWADFCRFLSGWAPEHYAREGYAGRMTELALAQT